MTPQPARERNVVKPAARTLRVCLLVDTVKVDAGTEMLVSALARRFDREGFEPHVCCFEDCDRLRMLGRDVRTAVFPTVRVYSPSGLRQIWAFRKYVEENSIDIVHSFMAKSDIFNVAAMMGARRAVVTSRLNTGYWYTPGLKRLFRILNRYTTHVITNSAYAKNVVCAAERLDPDKVTVFYPGTDLERYASSSGDPTVAQALGIPCDSQVVGIVANYRAVKDLPLFLRAAQIVAAADPKVVFLLVGKGAEKSALERLARELGISDRVFFSDGHGEVPDYLSRMSVACLSSLSEGLPNAIIEYMAAGLPVVATDVGGVSELVEDGVTGWLVRCRTPEAFAEPILRLIRDEGLRTGMGHQGLRRARGEFDLSAAVRRLESFYLQVAEPGQSDRQTMSAGAGLG